MEILNRNLRDNAKWRIVGMCFTLFILLGFICFASQQSYPHIGTGDKHRNAQTLSGSLLETMSVLGECERIVTSLSSRKMELQDSVILLKSKRNQLRTRTKNLKRELKNLES